MKVRLYDAISSTTTASAFIRFRQLHTPLQVIVECTGVRHYPELHYDENRVSLPHPIHSPHKRDVEVQSNADIYISTIAE